MTSFKGHLNEAKLSSNNLRSKAKLIAALTDRNAHTEAFMEVAKILGNKKIVAQLKGVEMITNASGYLPEHISKYRYELYKEMMMLGKRKYGDDWQIIKDGL